LSEKKLEWPTIPQNNLILQKDI